MTWPWSRGPLFKIGGHKPPRGHDSNPMTFHRILNFREAAPVHDLEIDGDRIMRYEQTQHERMPLGAFAPELPYAGKNGLHKPAALAQDEAGDVCPRGIRPYPPFDASGNFLECIPDSPPLLFQKPFSTCANRRRGCAPGQAQCPGPGKNRPTGTTGDVRIRRWKPPFSAPISLSVKPLRWNMFSGENLRFQSPWGVTLSGPGSLILNADDGKSAVEVIRGKHGSDSNTAFRPHISVWTPVRDLILKDPWTLAARHSALEGPESPMINGPSKWGRKTGGSVGESGAPG